VRHLQEHKKRQDGERRELGDAWPCHGLVFPSSIGAPIEPRNVNRRWDELRKKADRAGLRLHDPRHGCATFLQVSRVASGASFCGLRERALPAALRAGRCGTPALPGAVRGRDLRHHWPVRH